MQPNDFKLTAGWGHFGANQAVMPGQGKVKRRGDMVDVYLNNRAYWKDVPSEVWEYRLGGYQVLKKWLSYRESKVLGRALEVSEVAWFSEVARRVAGIVTERSKGYRSGRSIDGRDITGSFVLVEPSCWRFGAAMRASGGTDCPSA